MSIRGFGSIPVGGPDKSTLAVDEVVETTLSSPQTVYLEKEAATPLHSADIGDSVRVEFGGRVVGKRLVRPTELEGERTEQPYRQVELELLSFRTRKSDALAEVSEMLQRFSDVSPT